MLTLSAYIRDYISTFLRVLCGGVIRRLRGQAVVQHFDLLVRELLQLHMLPWKMLCNNKPHQFWLISMQFHSLPRIFLQRRIQLSYPPTAANRSMHSEDELSHDRLTRLLANGFSSSGFELIARSPP
ncbi:hypothetical protein Dsin_022986 [Dipteronia sinensis]|uniref:Uncharacterized protein n=1 Tax=Dipteronia sinensis TaxID=43782 RepID=A0AAE0E0F9_9ROSI|nr:hypothetical protein Dsin_022986 [Dipteronia sinensis]